jgi:glutaredoxin 3
MSDVTIYTTRICAYCFAAKRLLSARKIAYEEIDVSGDQDKRQWLVQVTGGRKTVPQIFIRGQSIGGYEELKALDQSGQLAPMLQAATP